MSEIESLNCRIKENIQKIEIYNIVSKNNRKIIINVLKKENNKLEKKMKILK